jgi:hypothetical protein
MVAWHEVPGRPSIKVPSGRERYDLWFQRRFSTGDGMCEVVAERQYLKPYPAGRNRWVLVSRHFVPGYHRNVPPGQKNFAHVSAAILAKGSLDFDEYE